MHRTPRMSHGDRGARSADLDVDRNVDCDVDCDVDAAATLAVELVPVSSASPDGELVIDVMVVRSL